MNDPEVARSTFVLTRLWFISKAHAEWVESLYVDVNIYKAILYLKTNQWD